MAAYGVLPAISGFRYDRKAGLLGFIPKLEKLSCFWALGDIWGTFAQNENDIEIKFLHGEFKLNELSLAGEITQLKLNGEKVSLPLNVKDGDILTVKIK